MSAPEWLSQASATAGITVGELQSWHRVMVRCGRCGRMSSTNTGILKAKARPADSIGGLKERLRCSSCGSRPAWVWVQNIDR